MLISVSTVFASTNPPPTTYTVTSLTTSTTTTTLTSTATVTTSSSTATNFGASRSIPAFGNLNLTLSLSATSIKSGQVIKINVAMANTLPDPNNVNSANSWPLVGLVDGSCGTLIYPMGIEIIRGTNLSAASSSYLALFVGPQTCPNGAGTPVSEWLFKADGLSQWALPVPFQAYNPMNATLQVSGYSTWNGIDPGTTVHHAFEPGIYTVAAGDAWGDLIVMQFAVT